MNAITKISTLVTTLFLTFSCSIKDVQKTEHEKSIGDGLTFENKAHLEDLSLGRTSISEEKIDEWEKIVDEGSPEEIANVARTLQPFFSTILIAENSEKSNYKDLLVVYNQALRKCQKLAASNKEKESFHAVVHDYYKVFMDGCIDGLKDCNNLHFFKKDYNSANILLMEAESLEKSEIEKFTHIMEASFEFQNLISNVNFSLMYAERAYDIANHLKEIGKENRLEDHKQIYEKSLNIIAGNFDNPEVTNRFITLLSKNDYEFIRREETLFPSEKKFLFKVIANSNIKKPLMDYFSINLKKQYPSQINKFKNVDSSYLVIIDKIYNNEWDSETARTVYLMTPQNEHDFFDAINQVLTVKYQEVVETINREVLLFYTKKKNQITNDNYTDLYREYCAGLAHYPTQFLERRGKLEDFAKQIIQGLATREDFQSAYNYMHSFETNFAADVMIPQYLINIYYAIKNDIREDHLHSTTSSSFYNETTISSVIARKALIPYKNESRMIDIGITINDPTQISTYRGFKNIITKNILQPLQKHDPSYTYTDFFAVILKAYLEQEIIDLENRKREFEEDLINSAYKTHRELCSDIQHDIANSTPIQFHMKNTYEFVFFNPKISGGMSNAKANTLHQVLLPYSKIVQEFPISTLQMQEQRLEITTRQLLLNTIESIYRSFAPEANTPDNPVLAIIKKRKDLINDYYNRAHQFNNGIISCLFKLYKKEFELRNNIIANEVVFLQNIHTKMTALQSLNGQALTNEINSYQKSIFEETFKDIKESERKKLSAKEFISKKAFKHSFVSFKLRLKQELERQVPNLNVNIQSNFFDSDLYNNELYNEIEYTPDQQTFLRNAIRHLNQYWIDNWVSITLTKFDVIEVNLNVAIHNAFLSGLNIYQQNGSDNNRHNINYILDNIIQFSNAIRLTEDDIKRLQISDARTIYPDYALEMFFLESKSKKPLMIFDNTMRGLNYYISPLFDFPRTFYQDGIKRGEKFISNDEEKFFEVLSAVNKDFAQRVNTFYKDCYDIIDKKESELKSEEFQEIAYELDPQTGASIKSLTFPRDSDNSYIFLDERLEAEYKNVLSEFDRFTDGYFIKD